MNRSAILMALLAACAAPAHAEVPQARWSDKLAVGEPAEQAISTWPDLAKAAARAMIEKYGKPEGVGKDSLVWYSNGSWKRTLVHQRAWPHYAFKRDKDYLENVIGYVVPNDKLEALTRFDKRIDVDQASAELSARSETEPMNYLALNLADEIIRGKRTVEEAREFQKTITRLAAAGKASAYLNSFLFDVHNDASPHPWSSR
jgi:hypothetical protein